MAAAWRAAWCAATRSMRRPAVRALAERWSEASARAACWSRGGGDARAAERYLAVAVDPRLGQPVLLAAPRGGVAVDARIEAARRPCRRAALDLRRLQPYHAVQRSAPTAGRARLAAAADVATRLYRLFREQEAIVAEINPLAETADGELIALDARVALDELALFRLPRWRELVLADEARSTGGAEAAPRLRLRRAGPRRHGRPDQHRRRRHDAAGRPDPRAGARAGQLRRPAHGRHARRLHAAWRWCWSACAPSRGCAPCW